jgi:hypothetical protein
MILPLLLAARAFACAPEPIPQIHPSAARDGASPAQVSFALDGTTLRAHFDVKAASVYGKPKLAPNEYPYMFDVAEVFVSAEGGVPYYEFEVTPFDQAFEVRIYYPNPQPPAPGVEPRKAFQNNPGVHAEHKAVRTKDGWTADLAIPLDRIGWRGDAAKIVGNAFVILGRKGEKRYFSRSLPPQEKPNFHLPAYFKPFLDCAAQPQRQPQPQPKRQPQPQPRSQIQPPRRQRKSMRLLPEKDIF